MTSDDLTITLLVFGSSLYLLMAILSLLRRGLAGRLAYLFALYAVVSALWGFEQVAERRGWLAAVGPEVAAHVPLYGLLLLSMLFIHVTRSFLRLERIAWGWWALGGVWIALLAALDRDVLRIPEITVPDIGWTLEHQGLIFGVLVFGWGIFTCGATLLTTQAYRRTQQPLHRNRLKYWVPTLGFTVLGDALFLVGQVALGSALRLLGALVIAYVVLTHHLPDVRQITRRLVSYVIITVLSIIFYTAGFLGMQSVFQAVPGYSPLAVGAALALILALIFNPLVGLVQRMVNRVISAASYDPSRTVHEYGISISNILNVERLAAVALGLINKAIGIRRGMLFLVDQEQGEAGRTQIQLRGVRVMGGDGLASGTLTADSPFVIRLQYEYFPLTQYDIDLLPRFRGLSADERAWLSGLGMDVYVPIYAKSKWIGLLALGPKTSGDRYFDEDLTLLSTLADQTAVALENARLVEDLVRLNRDLDRANQQLEHLDRTKSDFISVVSHELRTPMAILLGYSQILVSDPSVKANADNYQLIEGLHRGAMRMEEIVESMVDMAMIDTRTLQLARNPVSLAALLQDVGRSYEEPLAQRRLALEIQDLSRLPEIEADREALRKVFDHLVSNAIKYTPNGGQIVISGRLLPAEQDGQMGDQVEVVVGDTGIGIDPRFQELIFTKFYQTGEVAVHSTGKTKFKGGGPGLGLTIARGIVEAHGGKIWAESPGCDEALCPGSQFYVVLPLHPPPLQPLGERQT